LTYGHRQMSDRRPAVHISGPIPEGVRAALAETFSLADSPEGAQGILAVTTRVDSTYLDSAGDQLKIVANYGAGVDNVDIEAAHARDVLVTNTPDVLTNTVAELAIALTLALLRRIVEGDRFLRRREAWSFSLEFMLGESLRDKTLGIVGPGRIGRATASLAKAFGGKPVLAGRGDDLDALLRVSDVVSLHCPLKPETHHLIDRGALETMRDTAVLVNTARGQIVNESDLVAALREGVIAGAALDVFEREPELTDELRTLDNVVLTPHIGSATSRTRQAMGMLAVEALRAVLIDSRTPLNVVS
jgi:glyoxylate reductase